MTRWAGLVAGAVLVSAAACGRSGPPPIPPPPDTPFVWQLPRGLPHPTVPADNPMTTVKVALGRRLFYDTRLSGNATFACATCHQQAHAFSDGRPQAKGSTGQVHSRSAMSLTNVAYNASFGWADPSARSLETQMAVPMFNEHPIELGLAGREAEIVQRFASAADEPWFRAAFPDDPRPVSLENVVRAVAAFERTLVSADSPFDRYLYRDDRTAISEKAIRGMKLFFSERVGCSGCHAGFNLSGPVAFGSSPAPVLRFTNTGLYDLDGKGAYPANDHGLMDKTKSPGDMGRFRAPTLRNIALTGPYMHDGSVPTLKGVIAHYAAGGKGPLKAPELKRFELSPAETEALVAFLESLTDSSFVSNPAFADPRPRQ
jgi:cytochrome c peroxidase